MLKGSQPNFLRPDLIFILRILSKKKWLGSSSPDWEVPKKLYYLVRVFNIGKIFCVWTITFLHTKCAMLYNILTFFFLFSMQLWKVFQICPAVKYWFPGACIFCRKSEVLQVFEQKGHNENCACFFLRKCVNLSKEYSHILSTGTIFVIYLSLFCSIV